jgi:hypothetical protein
MQPRHGFLAETSDYLKIVASMMNTGNAEENRIAL